MLRLFSRTRETDTENELHDIEWQVLTDSNRKGADVQRAFVTQALNTKDFAILEGPPGSGKTTVTLELIVQLILQNKRILLCSSTHVAIDNVLERLKAKGLIDKLNIFPIRVGSDGAIDDKVKEFRLGDFDRDYKDSLLERYKVYDDLAGKKKDGDKIGLRFFMQCANLVCGTTIGILQYPAFKPKKEERDIRPPIIPEFDYLIIDECSKTTFQEFLVPAMYAKKWILVGDTRQLSPFVEIDELVENIKNLPLTYNKAIRDYNFLGKEFQDSCILLFHLSELYRGNNNLKIAVAVDTVQLQIIEAEIAIRKAEGKDTFDVLDKIEVGYITRQKAYTARQQNQTMNVYFENLSKNWIFYDKALLDKSEGLQNPLAKIIPKSFMDLSSIENNALFYQYCSLPSSRRYSYRFSFTDFDPKDHVQIKTQHIYDFIEQWQKVRAEKSFASEIAWRLNREYEMRTFEGKQKERYTKTIDELLPKCHKEKDLIRNKIGTIATIALPSILESLIKGMSDVRNKDQNCILAKGLHKEELQYKRSILNTQGRMHKDISHFPREQFYKEDNALQDLDSLKREWGYERYEKRSVWIDVKGEKRGGKNEEEARRLMQELRTFVDYAKAHPHPISSEGEEWSVAVLSFYKGQVRFLEKELQELTGLKHKTSNFSKRYGDQMIHIKLCTVDKFQGQEADIVFLSMVNTKRPGFLDSPNRLNVGITRAKFQFVVLGDYAYFSKCKNHMLEAFSKAQMEKKI